MKRVLVLIGGIVILICAACGSAAAAVAINAPTAAATPSPTPTSAPTPIPTASNSPMPVASAPVLGAGVTLRSVGDLGSILVGASGETLYVFTHDTGTTSTCDGSCAQNWPPLTTVGTPRALGGVLQRLLGVTSRGNGVTQVTYNGHPLYYFIADGRPGVANGENLNAFGGHWEAVNADAMTIVK